MEKEKLQQAIHDLEEIANQYYARHKENFKYSELCAPDCHYKNYNKIIDPPRTSFKYNYCAAKSPEYLPFTEDDDVLWEILGAVKPKRAKSHYLDMWRVYIRFVGDCLENGQDDDAVTFLAIFLNFIMKSFLYDRLKNGEYKWIFTPEKLNEDLSIPEPLYEYMENIFWGIIEQDYNYFKKAAEIKPELNVAHLYLFISDFTDYCALVAHQDDKKNIEEAERKMLKQFNCLSPVYQDYVFGIGGEGKLYKDNFYNHRIDDPNLLPYIQTKTPDEQLGSLLDNCRDELCEVDNELWNMYLDIEKNHKEIDAETLKEKLYLAAAPKSVMRHLLFRSGQISEIYQLRKHETEFQTDEVMRFAFDRYTVRCNFLHIPSDTVYHTTGKFTLKEQMLKNLKLQQANIDLENKNRELEEKNKELEAAYQEIDKKNKELETINKDLKEAKGQLEKDNIFIKSLVQNITHSSKNIMNSETLVKPGLVLRKAELNEPTIETLHNTGSLMLDQADIESRVIRQLDQLVLRCKGGDEIIESMKQSLSDEKGEDIVGIRDPSLSGMKIIRSQVLYDESRKLKARERHILGKLEELGINENKRAIAKSAFITDIQLQNSLDAMLNWWEKLTGQNVSFSFSKVWEELLIKRDDAFYDMIALIVNEMMFNAVQHGDLTKPVVFEFGQAEESVFGPKWAYISCRNTIGSRFKGSKHQGNNTLDSLLQKININKRSETRGVEHTDIEQQEGIFETKAWLYVTNCMKPRR